ncbi:MAG: SpoIIE family protein phosphatase [Candidatus Cloacimonetes bacterium]|nr:SpoIIE family protein phosphatase [Candidatus Cloacimonadota bacterium]
MKIKKIQYKILILLSTILLLSLGTSLLMVWKSVSQNLESQITNDLDSKYNLIEILLKAEETGLKKQASLLSEEPTLKMSLQTKDSVTVQDTGSQLQEIVENDLLLVVTEELKLMANFPRSIDYKLPKSQDFLGSVMEDGLKSSIWIINGKTYLIAASPVEFHDFVIGVVIVGKQLGNRFTKFLSKKSKSPVSIYSDTTLLSSSWGQNFVITAKDRMKIDNTVWQGKFYNFQINKESIQFYLQSSYSHIERLLNEISSRLLILGVLVFGIALFISFLFSRQLTRPIKSLMDSAKDLQEGIFENKVVVDSGDELLVLGNSFESMRVSLIAQREELIKTENMKKDLELAAKIQTSLLPKNSPNFSGVNFDAKLLPSSHVGGDYYGYFTEPENGFGVVIADVSGHGTASAILMAMARSVLLSQPLLHDQPAKLLEFVNKVLYDDLEEAECFISMFYLFYDKATQTIKYSNAGHNRPLHYSNQAYQELDTDGMLVGILDDAEYEEKELKINEGDFVVLYTDGLTEPHNKEQEEYSVTRLKAHFLKNDINLVESLYDDVDDFAGENAYYDDRTCVYMRFES